MVEATKQLIVVVQKTLHGVPVVFITVSTVFPKYWSSLCEMVCATIFLFCPRFERSYCVVFSDTRCPIAQNKHLAAAKLHGERLDVQEDEIFRSRCPSFRVGECFKGT